MVAITETRKANDEYFIGRPIVAVFVGGTSGIGENGVKALARLAAVKSSYLRIYIAGRSQENFDRINTECKEICANAEIIFVSTHDIRLMKEVDRITNEIIRQERDVKNRKARIDLLCVSQGEISLTPRDETEEGIDKLASLGYYSRMKCIVNLVPLLLEADQPHVISIFAAGLEDLQFDKDDMSVRKPGTYGLFKVRTHVCVMTTFFFEHLAKQYPKLSLVHTMPGFVATPLFTRAKLGFVFRLVWTILGPLNVWLRSIPAPDSGTRTLYYATPHFPARNLAPPAGNGDEDIAIGTDGKLGSGAYATGLSSDKVVAKFDYDQARKEGLGDAIWDFTMQVFNDIEKTGKTTT